MAYINKALKKQLKRGIRFAKNVVKGTTGIRSKWPLEKKIQHAMDLFESNQGYRFDIHNPVLFNEKVIWYKLFYTRDGLVNLVDKFLFKEYISEKLGDGYTIPMFGVWDNIADFRKDWNNLPEEFFLKSTLQSDGRCMLHISNRSQLSYSEIEKKVVEWLKPENTLINSFCYAYYGAKPRVLAEAYETEVDGQLYDYKVFCFQGEPKYFYVATDHFPGQISHISFYDLNWKRLDVHYGKHPNCDVEKPREFGEMLRIAKVLSEGFPFLRVDFFETKKKLYVAELTLYPGGGQTPIYPKEFDAELGKQFVLPTI